MHSTNKTVFPRADLRIREGYSRIHLFVSACIGFVGLLIAVPTVFAQNYQDECMLYMQIGEKENGDFSPLITKDGNCVGTHGTAGGTLSYLEGTIYLTLPDATTAQTVGQDLVDDEVIDSFSQPFAGIELPEIIRIYFDKDDYTNDEISFYIAHNYPDAQIEEIPLFAGAQLAPNDPEWTKQWYLDAIGFDEARDYCGPATKEVKVAVIDNGFQVDHPDLASQVEDQVDVAHGDDDASVKQTGKGHNHGTLAAGIVGAVTDNNEGIASASDNSVEVTLIKAASDSAKGSNIDHGLEAFAKAAEADIDVAVAAWGAFGADFPVFRKVIKKVLEGGTQIVAAAGNYSSSEPFYPAAYDEVIAVAAVNKENKQTWFTNFGPWVDLAAPGENIITTDVGSKYVAVDGTSQAAPLVAGAMGFALAHDKSISDLFAGLERTDNTDIGEGILSMKNLCEKPTCTINYPQLDYRKPKGVLDDTDLEFLRGQYLEDFYIEDCNGKRYGKVCCPEGFYCDLNVDGAVNQQDAIYWLWIRLGYINFDICGDGIDNDCDGQNDDEEPHCQ